MKILLTGGGSGGHITPLLAVAKELKKLDNEVVIEAVCEKDGRFAELFKTEPAITKLHKISAGKYRRFGGLSTMQKLLNYKVHIKNVQDIGKVCIGYAQARRLLKQFKPDGILIKGGYVGVPVGLAAASLKIPFITHDSDTLPGLANKIIARWAYKHATGMPIEFYDYPKGSTVYVGVPISSNFKRATPDLVKSYRKTIGLSECDSVITVIGGSQGGEQLNEDMLKIAGRLMQHYPKLGIAHIAGEANAETVLSKYKNELLSDELKRVVVRGFVSDVYNYTGSADIVVSRASATVVAELAVQGKAAILVPGRLAGDHQTANAKHLAKIGAAAHVVYGDVEGLYNKIIEMLGNETQIKSLATKLHDKIGRAPGRERV